MDDENELQIRSMLELREYEKVRLLGAGGFGKVYLIQHSVTGVNCTAKEQKCSKWSKEEATVLKKLENHEVSFLGQLNNIDAFENIIILS